MKSKILFVLGRVGTNTGAFKSLLGNVIELKKRGIDCTVLVARDSEGDILKKYGIEVKKINYYSCTVPANNPSFIKKMIKTILNFIAEIKVYIYLKHNDFDIIHFNTSSVSVGATSAFKLNKKVIWHLREFLEEDVNLTYINKRKMKKNLQKANKVIAISNAVKKHFVIQYDLKNIVTIYNGIDIKDFRKINIDSNEKFAFTFIGRIVREKGQIDAIKAMTKICSKYENVFLKVVGKIGDEIYYNELKKIIDDNHLTKNIMIIEHTNSLENIWNETDIGIVGSKKEAFGRVTAEFMLNGIPIIGTNSGGTIELLSEQRGLLYDYNNVESLVKQMEFSIMNKDRMKIFAKNAYDFAKKNLTISNYSNSIIQIYNEIED